MGQERQSQGLPSLGALLNEKWRGKNETERGAPLFFFRGPGGGDWLATRLEARLAKTGRSTGRSTGAAVTCNDDECLDDKDLAT